MSKIGKKLIVVPSTIKVKIDGGKVFLEGPKGKLDLMPHQNIKVSFDDAAKTIHVERINDERLSKSVHGLTRTLIANMVEGVLKGFEKRLRIEGIGYQAKMDKKAYTPSGAVEEYTDNLTAAGQENLVYDEINPNEEWITDNIEGSSRTGNNPEWANTGESDVNKKRNTIRKKNILGQIKKKAYNKAPQPTVNDNAGEDEGSKLMAKLESLEPKQSKQISEEFDRMKSLITYKGKTQ